MNVSLKSLGMDRLSVEERLALVEELWDSIAEDSAAVPLTDAQCAELDRAVELAAGYPERFSIKHNEIRCVQARRFP